MTTQGFARPLPLGFDHEGFLLRFDAHGEDIVVTAEPRTWITEADQGPSYAEVMNVADARRIAADLESDLSGRVRDTTYLEAYMWRSGEYRDLYTRRAELGERNRARLDRMAAGMACGGPQFRPIRRRAITQLTRDCEEERIRFALEGVHGGVR